MSSPPKKTTKVSFSMKDYVIHFDPKTPIFIDAIDAIWYAQLRDCMEKMKKLLEQIFHFFSPFSPHQADEDCFIEGLLETLSGTNYNGIQMTDLSVLQINRKTRNKMEDLKKMTTGYYYLKNPSSSRDDTRIRASVERRSNNLVEGIVWSMVLKSNKN